MIYLGQPYSSPDPALVQTRVLMGQGTCAALRMEGKHVYSPIGHWHEIATRFNLPTDAGPWHDTNCHMINLCEAFYLLALPGWQRSIGLQAEVRYAIKHLKPIFSVRVLALNYDPDKHLFHIPTIAVAPISDLAALLRYFSDADDHKEPGPDTSHVNGPVEGRN